MINKRNNNPRISTTSTKVQRSRLFNKELKCNILKYATAFSSYKMGVIYNLEKPSEMYDINEKTTNCSLGADRNGFFVYNSNNARSKSFPSPLKIDKKSIDFIESTG